MPTTDPNYYQMRYKEDATYRAAVVAATIRWQERQRVEDPEAFAERSARSVARRRERYQNDPVFREKFLEAQRRRRRGAAAAASASASSGTSEAGSADDPL